MRYAFVLMYFICCANAFAQVDLPVFGKQQVINGYAKDIEGEVLSYFSVYPEHATTALLTRCTDGKKAIAWETAVVPHYTQDENIQYYYFSWIAAHSSTTSSGDRDFDLFIDDRLALTFTTHPNTKPGSWSAAAADSTKLVFEFNKMDRHGDAHGFAHLRVPGKYITPGKSVRLKIVGHAQDSPDWFMTFRYSFEEKVEAEVLPFLTKDHKQLLSLTAMHFGDGEELIITLNGHTVAQPFLLHHGLNTFQVPMEPFGSSTNVHVKVTQPAASCLFPLIRNYYERDMDLVQTPVIHRDIYRVHHSHNDIGYSNLQTDVVKIQNKNIYDALDLIDRTKDYPKDSRFVWNIESLWAVENFLGVASEVDKQRFITAVKSGSIALSANYANVLTGLCTPEEMYWIVEYADSLRKWYGLPITMAMQTDIPGMSWSMVDAYAAHGIHYLSQGPNYIPDMPDGGDRIGSTLREQGDKPYWWKGTTGTDSILVWTAGHGYSDWHGFTPGAIKERGTQKIADYMNALDAKGYPYDMVQWRYNIVSDNGPTDSTLSDFVRDWNEKYASPHLIIANAGDMMKKFEEKYGKNIPTWSGDFTPYWEDGAYSTAKEEGNVRVLSARLSNLIDAAKILGKPIDPHLLYRAKRSIVMWHEHTWGSWNSISESDAPFTTEQWKYKKAFADSAGWYVDHIEATLLLPFRGQSKLEVINTLPWNRYGVVELPEETRAFNSVTSSDGRTESIYSQSDIRPYFMEFDERSAPIHSYTLSPKLNFIVLDGAYINAESSAGSWLGLNGISADTSSVAAPCGLAEWRLMSSTMPLGSERPARKKGDDKSSRRTGALILTGTDSILSILWEKPLSPVLIRSTVYKKSVRDKESLHLALPFNIPNATVRIGISDTCITPESGRIPGSNNDFFCAQRWIDVSNDSMGVTIVCPQGALWEIGDMVDERKVNPGKGTNPEYYKAWKTEAHSSSTIYLYALNNYWHTNFKADQEGPITFDIYLKMHGPFKLEEARRFGLEMTRPLITWWK